MTAGQTETLLWPRFEQPSDLQRVESVPLADRGVPSSSTAALLRAAELWPERPAISVLPDAAHWQRPHTRTFAELAADVQRAAYALVDAGVGPGQAVTLLSVNCEELLTALLAAQAVGVAAPINPALSPEHAIDLVTLSGARVIVASGPELDAGAWAVARRIAAATSATTLLALRPTGADTAAPALEPLPGIAVAYLEERMRDAPAEGMDLASPASSDFATFLHTGGTTGAPKLAARTHGNELANAWQVASTSTLQPYETVFAALPLFHANAVVLTLVGPLLKGQHVLWAGPQGYRDVALYGVFWKLVEHHRVAAMSAVPTVYGVLNQVPVDADISVLRYPIVGAAPLSRAVADTFEQHTGTPLLEGYGLTEATCASSRNWPQGLRRGTVGQRLPYQEVRAVDVDPETGEWTPLLAGEVGTLTVRGPNVFAGYLRSGTSGPTADPGSAVRDGWLNTGDLGSVDADGYVSLAGRAKDLIIRGGHNIDPAVIEEALLEHPGVIDASAVGQPDAHAGEVPVAFVVLAPGTSTEAETLVAWAADHVPERAAAPKRVEIIDMIPLTDVGKPYKPELRRRAAEFVAQAALPGATSVAARLEAGRVVITIDAAAADDAETALAPLALDWELNA